MIDFNFQFLIFCIINTPAKIDARIEFVNAVKSGIRKILLFYKNEKITYMH